MRIGNARAHTNIALIKYWGKRDDHLILPFNSSLSLTLHAFYTDTSLSFDADVKRDTFYLNGILQNGDEAAKISRFVDLFRDKAGIKSPALIQSINHVPTAAGLASSASGFAALSGAANLASGLNLDKKELSMMARRGSGSATRSIYGGFVEWQKGSSMDDSYAVAIDDANWDIAMVVVIINKSVKAISSREAMKRTVDTSPFYEGWLKSTDIDLINIKTAIKNQDFEQLGIITESNGMKMHATMLGINPPLSYFEPETILAMQMVRTLRNEGMACYFTMDAGPNVKILCRMSDSIKIKERLSHVFHPENLIVSGPGSGIIKLD